jgi:hypothetical protein
MGYGNYLSLPELIRFIVNYLTLIPDGVVDGDGDGDDVEGVEITLSIGPHSLMIAELHNVNNYSDGRAAAAASASAGSKLKHDDSDDDMSPSPSHPPQEQSRLLLKLTDQPIPNFPFDLTFCTTYFGAQTLVTPLFLRLIEVIVLSGINFADVGVQHEFKGAFQDIHSHIIKAKVTEILEHFKCSGGNRQKLINDLQDPESSDLVYILKQCALRPNVQFIKGGGPDGRTTLLSNLFGAFNVDDFKYEPTKREVREALAIFRSPAEAHAIEHMNLYAFTVCYRITIKYKSNEGKMKRVSFTAILDKNLMTTNGQPAVLFNYNELLAAMTCDGSTFFDKVIELIGRMGVVLPVRVNAGLLKSLFISSGRAVVILNGCSRILMCADSTSFRGVRPAEETGLTRLTRTVVNLFKLKLNIYGSARATPEDIRVHIPPLSPAAAAGGGGGGGGGGGDGLHFFQGVLHKADYPYKFESISVPRENADNPSVSKGVKNVERIAVGVVVGVPRAWGGVFSDIDPNVVDEFIQPNKGKLLVDSQVRVGEGSPDPFFGLQSPASSVASSVESSIARSVERSVERSPECAVGGEGVVVTDERDFVESLSITDPLNTKEDIGLSNTLKQAAIRFFGMARTIVRNMFTSRAESVERPNVKRQAVGDYKTSSVGGKHKRIFKKTMKKYKKRRSIRGRGLGRTRSRGLGRGLGRTRRRTIKN